MNSDPTQSTSFTDKARGVATDLKESATDAARRAKENAQGYAQSQKSAAAGRIDRYGDAIDESARSLEGDDPNIAWLTHQAADRLHQAAEYLRERDFAELKEDAADFARRHPGVFLGGLFVTGLLLGNLAKVARPQNQEGYAG